ncbi:hypothetical protein KIK84_10230 [Curvibacter sp. CHRR-16]|uniref:hypothetical protein n=1 Tax=Curvibacter sp. CHRR-16 TaxID=2835872 RepID=UPI001BDACD6C|nr:hypothetical protein [Curvibacter sp. CHRR-16]MBT0570707.1 hypothetical protein [Curvibacter sp. CHRR-16]
MVQIFVLVRQLLHPVSGKWVRDPADAQAVALALQTVPAEQVRLFSLGALQPSVAADYMAQGAPVLHTLLGDNGDSTPAAVAAWLRQQDQGAATVLLLGQSPASDAADATAPVLPYLLAQQLQWLCLRDIGALRSVHTGWQLQQVLPKGARRQWQLSASAVLSVHASALVAKRYAPRDAQRGVLHEQVISAVSTATPTPSVAVQTVPTVLRVQPLQARQKKSGHERMLGAIGSPGGGSQSKALVLEAGTVQDKAQAVYDYLDTHSLWSFS